MKQRKARTAPGRVIVYMTVKSASEEEMESEAISKASRFWQNPVVMEYRPHMTTTTAVVEVDNKTRRKQD